MPPKLDQVAADADALLLEIQVKGGDLSPAFAALQKGIQSFEGAGHRIDELIPATAPAGLGARSLQAKTGKGFWEIYSKAIRKTLCAKKSKLRTAIDGGSGSLAGYVMTALALPVTATVIVAPIVAILVSVGVDAYCEWSKEGLNDH